MIIRGWTALFSRGYLSSIKLTPDEGLEPATLRLKVWCSTDWANRACLLIWWWEWRLPAPDFNVPNEFKEKLLSRSKVCWKRMKVSSTANNCCQLLKSYPPRRGIEPRSPAWQAGILTTILPRMSLHSELINFISLVLNCRVKVLHIWRNVIMENPGIDPGASRMQSERSPVWANSPCVSPLERNCL